MAGVFFASEPKVINFARDGFIPRTDLQRSQDFSKCDSSSMATTAGRSASTSDFHNFLCLCLISSRRADDKGFKTTFRSRALVITPTDSRLDETKILFL